MISLKDKIKEIKVNKSNKSITFINNGIAFSQFGIADEILDLITNLQETKTNMEQELQELYLIKDNLQEENEELKVENEKLTQLWLDSQEKRRKAIEYLEKPYRDNFDYSKAQLLNILEGDKDD